jgi:hypothetical protein
MDFCFDPIDLSLEKKSPNDLTNNLKKTQNSCDKYDKYEEYDNTTIEFYRTLRLFKLDPITNQPILDNLLIEFEYMWDPITGNIMDKDPYGPLCFNALGLYDYYYSNRCNGLWNPAVQEFQGYYGDLLGSGTNLVVNHKPCPEKYLYRLPIIDCYMKKSQDSHSLITMGPLLTLEQINQIDTLTATLRKKKPSLKILKEYYDQALNDNPNIDELKKSHPKLNIKELKEKYNKNYVEQLLSL